MSNTIAQQEKGIVGEDNWLSYWTEFKSSKEPKPEHTKILPGDLKGDFEGDTIVLKKREVYLLYKDVFVTGNTTLIIEPGTLILADHKTQATLTITSGSKIIAQGEQTDPIVFTSNRDVPKAGDWGGITILGNAPINKISERNRINNGIVSYTPGNLDYGGTDNTDNSGSLEYVRIEYAGKRTKNAGYFDALSLYSVGSQTMLANVMISYSKGNSLYVAGGEVNLTKFISYKASRTDYKFDYGTQANISNSLAVRSPYDSSSKELASLHVTSYSSTDEADFAKAETSVTASNLTLLNPSKDLKNGIEVGLVHQAVYVDVNTTLKMDRSVLSGFNPAVIFSSKIALNDKNLQRIKFSKMYFNSCEGNIFIENSTDNADLENWYGSASFQNYYSKDEDGETFIDTKNIRNLDYRLRVSKIIASNK